MVETLDAYKQRTVFMWDSFPQSGCFFTNDNLRNKVITNGIRVIAGIAYVAYICAGGSGFNIAVGLNGE